MTIMMKLGRRRPKPYNFAAIKRLTKLITFQEHMWYLLKQALSFKKKVCNSKKQDLVNATIEMRKEADGMLYEIDWIILTISSSFADKEVDEYEECLNFYDGFAKSKSTFQKDFKVDDDIIKPFSKSKIITEQQYIESRANDVGAIKHKNIARKISRSGIVLIIEKDW